VADALPVDGMTGHDGSCDKPSQSSESRQRKGDKPP